MKPIIHTQHLPICAHANPVVVAHPTPFRRQTGTVIQHNSINLLKTLNPSQKDMVRSWTRYVWLLEGIFYEDVEQTTYPVYQKNQRACVKSTRKYASDPFDNGTIETGNALMNNMKEEKKKRWDEVITSTNMTHNSRKAWKIIKNLSNDPTSPIAPCLESVNQVAHQHQRHDI